jgi:3-methylfumaryl-CoA hydratase
MGLDLAIEPTLLFRFSALTYNAHRIHYDRQWAVDREGYPGLVVHGPLQAIGLAELCRRYCGERIMRSFRFRAIRPAFDDGPLLLRGTTDGRGDRATLVAFDHGGTPTMTAEAELAELA